MKKQWTSFFVGVFATAIMFSTVGAAFAASQKQATLEFDGIKLMVDGKYIDVTDSKGNPTEPFIIDGTTYLPVGNVAKLVGYGVKWDGETRTVILELPDQDKPTFITRTGKKYHNDPTCNGGTYWEVPLETAVGMGLEPCDKCVHD